MFVKYIISFLIFLSVAITIWKAIPKKDSYPDSLRSSYDYVIGENKRKVLITRKYNFSALFTVGAGAAGCVLANRLSEDPDVRVLLLEAGLADDSRYIAEIPYAAAELRGTDLDWAYKTAPQRNACLSCNEQVRSMEKTI